ncbi:MAG: hypothetical protein WCP06_03975 [Verrucomicrobiota bacterium]
MDLFSVILFLGNYYLKPQEWAGFMSSLRPVQLSMMLGVAALLNREKKTRIGDLIQTPHDRALLLFFLWVILTSGKPFTTFTAVSNLIVFYIVIVQTLNTLQRMKVFLNWWCVFIVIVAGLAILSEYGFDPFGSYDITHGHMKDRLILNISIFNNPNSLAHSVVPAIPMLYFLMLWNRNFFMKSMAILAISIPLYCIYLTVSKGAFLAGFVSLLATLTFGRPKTVQIALLVLGIGFGYGALYMLPRMSELNKSKSDEAIQGRIAAYTYGYKCVTTLPFGIGYYNWMDSFYQQSRRYRIVKTYAALKGGGQVTIKHLVPERYRKAAHGSFNQMGAELGFTGLALFFGMVWCNLRTLCTAQTANSDEERIRRILFVLNLTYLVSSWMVDFGYRATFFMFTAASAAFHRHLTGVYRLREKEIADETASSSIPVWQRRLQPASVPKIRNLAIPTDPRGAIRQSAVSTLPVGSLEIALSAPLPLAETRNSSASDAAQANPAAPLKVRPLTKTSADPGEALEFGVIDWNRYGILEMTMPFVIASCIVRFWHHILQTM